MPNVLSCNLTADYSKIMGDRILPFLFTLNTENSVLSPVPGESQIFCYDILGVGQDTSLYADLSHFVLGICNTITLDDITDISVIIDGKTQTVIRGENVVIRTTENPDPPTGCVGLKFDFPLNKVEGEMQVCITMASVYTVGPVNVCVFGGNTTATGLTICGPSCGSTNPCENVFYQKETVCVPVTVTPFAKPGTATATCCGEPVVTSGATCTGTNRSCRFTITQTLCIEIPISFGAVIETGDAVVQCGDITTEECDCDTAVTEPAVTSTQAHTTQTARDRRFFNR